MLYFFMLQLYIKNYIVREWSIFSCILGLLKIHKTIVLLASIGLVCAEQ